MDWAWPSTMQSRKWGSQYSWSMRSTDGGGELLAALFDVVDGIMLERGDEFEVLGIIALQAFDVGDADAAIEEGIFAEAFIDAAPVRACLLIRF